MAITQTTATSFKLQCLNGIHAFGTSVVRASTTPDVFKIALYTSSATLDDSTTVYTTSGEVVGTGYVAGGATLTTVTPASSGTTAYTGFSDVTWSNSTITANGALIYNSSQGNKVVAVLAFGGDKTTVASPFTIAFPTTDVTDALVRFT